MMKTPNTQLRVVQQTSHKLRGCLKMGLQASRTCWWSRSGKGRDECLPIRADVSLSSWVPTSFMAVVCLPCSHEHLKGKAEADSPVNAQQVVTRGHLTVR